MAVRNPVQRAFDAFGKASFREKHAGTWRRQVGAVEQSVNLQKSQYSRLYYINVDLAFATDADIGHVRGRAGSLLSPEDASRLDTLLDIDGTKMEDEHREHQLLELFDQLTPLLDGLNSVEAMADHERQGRFVAMGITGPARDAFDSLH